MDPSLEAGAGAGSGLVNNGASEMGLAVGTLDGPEATVAMSRPPAGIGVGLVGGGGV